jgi:hypothetical protein
MISETHRKKFIIFAAIVFALSFSKINCTSRLNNNPTYERLKDYIDTIKVVNTHEHQRWFPQYENHDIIFYTLLNHSYLQADLVSAGAQRLDTETINRRDLEDLWDTQGRFLDFSRNTSYYSHFLEGFRILY